jgi:hypothetical protein
MNRTNLKYVVWVLGICSSACFLFEFFLNSIGPDGSGYRAHFYGLGFGATTLLFAILLFITQPER